MLRRVVRIGAIGSIVGLSAAVGVCSYTNHEFNAIGVVRFGRCASTAVKIAVDYKWNLRNIDSNSDEYEERLSKIHLRSASRLKEVFCKNGGIFIKVGQHIGSLDYLLPEEYVKTMKTLHDKAPESEISELFETVEKDLKCKISDVFSEIEDKPIGTASLAQCHRAKLKDGTLVAVKIQHPSVKKNSNADIVTMLFLVKCLAKLFPEFRFVWLAEETQRNLPVELDFINEGRNIEKVAKMLSDYKFVKVPKVYWKYCSDRVLTMEFCEGIRVDDYKHMKDAGINLNKISERMGMIYSRMIFSHGFVHCDPHPGNVLVNPVGEKSKKTKDREFQIVLLDHGLYQSLTKAFRYNYANMWMALLEKDMEKLKKLSTYFNVEDFYGLFACIVTGRSWDAINKGINNTDFTQSESVHIKAEASKYLREISSVLNRIPREMLLLLKTNDLLRGIESSLNTRNSSSSFIPMSKCCVKLINSYERETKREAYRDAKIFFNFDFFRLVKFDLFSYCREKFYLFKILTYEMFLYLVDFYPITY